LSEILEKTLNLLREGTLPVLLPLILVCLGIWTIILERAVYLYGRSFTLGWWPPARQRLAGLKATLVDAFDAYLDRPTDENRQELLRLCREELVTPYTTFLARVVERDEEIPPDLRDLQLAEAGLTEEMRIERGIPILSSLAKAAPLLGLLGTVIGMIQTFRVMMFASTSDPRALSSGISIALIATLVGLVVALPGVIGTSWLSRRAQTLVEEIHLASIRFRQSGDSMAARAQEASP
jgi:biopolymer transport protein ExbB/TolQ